MLSTSHRRGTKRRGTIDITAGSAAYVYAYRRARDGGVETIGLVQIAGPRGDSAIGEIAANAVEALDAGPLTWAIERDAAGVTVRLASYAEAAA